MVNTGVEMLILENCMLTAFAIDNIYSLVLLRELFYPKGNCNVIGQSLKLVPVNYVTKKAAAMPLDKVSILAPKILVKLCLFV